MRAGFREIPGGGERDTSLITRRGLALPRENRAGRPLLSRGRRSGKEEREEVGSTPQKCSVVKMAVLPSGLVGV